MEDVGVVNSLIQTRGLGQGALTAYENLIPLAGSIGSCQHEPHQNRILSRGCDCGVVDHSAGGITLLLGIGRTICDCDE
jgi:hypothetical protein